MRSQSHFIIAFICATAIFYFLLGLGDLQLILLGFFAAICALIPDIDHGESKGRKMLNNVVIAGAFLLAYLSSCNSGICIPGIYQWINIAVLTLAMLGLYFMFMNLGLKHRGITHSIVACLAFSVLLYLFIDRFFALAGFIGYFSHLVADKEIKLI